MSSKRFTGKTESDAVMNAAMELGIPSTDLDYEVIDPGSNGFFGLFKKPAIIEVKEKVKEPEVKKEAAPAPAKPQKQPVKKEKEEKKREKKTADIIRKHLQNKEKLLLRKKRRRIKFRKISTRLHGAQRNTWMKF